jgi:alkylation response protein AidB-like acyl-CoA dehydrogenase
MSAGCVGTAEAALAASRDHVRTRRQFGRVLGAFDATRAQIAAMAARVFAMESVVRDVAVREALSEDIERESTMAKVFCSEGAFEVCDRAVQLHGALGFLEPVGVARMLRDCRITRIFEGANDVLLVRLGAAIVTHDAPRDPARAILAGPACRALETRARSAIRRTRREYGVRVVEHQLVLQRIARAMIALHAAEVVSARRDADPSADATALATLAVDLLVDEGERALDALLRTADEEAEVAAVVRDDLVPQQGAPR